MTSSVAKAWSGVDRVVVVLECRSYLEVDAVDRGDRVVPVGRDELGHTATDLVIAEPFDHPLEADGGNRGLRPRRGHAREIGRDHQAGPLSWVSRRATRSCEWAALCPARLCVSSRAEAVPRGAPALPPTPSVTPSPALGATPRVPAAALDFPACLVLPLVRPTSREA